MCGIVGYLGTEQPMQFIVDKLKNLEYRGYDSAGIASLEGGNFKIFKSVGNLSKLDEVIPSDEKSLCAIAHTRWATHGKPTEVNAHPHTSQNGEWALVHNGIIENYLEIKNSLAGGEKIASDTDTAVVSQLLEEKQVQDVFGFIQACEKLVGSYAFLAMNKNIPNTLFMARRKSPLYCAEKNGNILIASDPICFCGFSQDYYVLNDGEFAVATSGNLEFFNNLGEKVLKQTILLDEIFEDSGKGTYPHFMLKEIMEEKTALNRIVKCYSDNNVLSKLDRDFVGRFKTIIFIGCGTAYHAGLVGSRMVEKCARVSSICEIASEFIYKDPIISRDNLYIFVSQSGETADTLRAMELVKSAGCTTIALTNVLYSSLARAVDFVFPVCAGPEIAVASTKAYVCQVAVLYMLAKRLEELKSGETINYIENIKSLENDILNLNYEQLDKIAEELKDQKDCIYIGKDLDYVTACEASLKLKEIAYINANAYPSGELKHGFLALVEEGTMAFVLANDKKINQKTYNSASEAMSRGARTVLVGGEVTDGFVPAYHILVPERDELLSPILSVVPLQYLAYLVSVKREINPDQPRNLAKSVTVE